MYEKNRYFIGGYEPVQGEDRLRTTPLTTRNNSGPIMGIAGHTFVTIGSNVYMNGGKTAAGVCTTEYRVEATQYSVSFTVVESAIPARYYHTACVYDTRTYMFGGYDQDNKVTNTLIVLGGMHLFVARLVYTMNFILRQRKRERFAPMFEIEPLLLFSFLKNFLFY